MMSRDIASAQWVLAISVLLLFGCSSQRPVLSMKSIPVNDPQPSPVLNKTPLDNLPMPELPAEVAYFSHRVRWPGETLIDMARWYTGSGDNWMRLVDANPSINPKMILIGNSIRIPEALLKTRHPMPRKFISRKSADTGRQTSVSEGMRFVSPIESKREGDDSPTATNITRRPSVSEESPLFGPIETNSEKEGSRSGPAYPPLETIK